MTISRPPYYAVPFANSGTKNTIPVASTGTGKASFTDGFPPVTMTPISAGGIPPEGKDFNGILYDITSHTIWVNAGGQYRFDATLSTAIGGYPAGMVIQSDDGVAAYVSAVDNNTIDFNSTPASIGVEWLPYGGAAISNITIATTGGDTVLTAVQALAQFITITGTLVADATITLPAKLGKWTVINNTTGAYSVTVSPLAGTGVTVFQAKASTLYGDGAGVIDYDLHSSQTRPASDSTKHLATTEFVTNAIGAIPPPNGPKWVNKALVTATGNYTVPAGIYALRVYAIGAGANGARPGTDGGSGGGCAWGEIAVTPAQVIPVTISGGQAQFGTYLTATHGVGPTTPGTGSVGAGVTNSGTATGGQGGSGGGGGGASGSPLGTGGNGASVAGGGGGAWGGFNGATAAGAGVGGHAATNAPGGSGGAMAVSYAPGRTQFTAFTDPLLAPCVGAVDKGPYNCVSNGPGTGGDILLAPGYGGGAGPKSDNFVTGAHDGSSIFGGGAGGGYNGDGTQRWGGNAGYGGGGGGGSNSSQYGGLGGPACVAIFY